ncbi:YjbF family lipoprotein [Citreimonas salinaria]|uniref:Group 4 capsule polysaccharide lipoprotein gfcB, YjbF n=1 Tax=Citreimonas salinaria TaxID=321339 RepID=A0A1H3FDD9_9RHOB|nr:YjbF family lipoprotein [Citreimonas salinaria]SDX89103.1 Group 4 capsule polysaccharide lipoprotein gfcB, YjbF [Citreimonas salinaria]
MILAKRMRRAAAFVGAVGALVALGACSSAQSDSMRLLRSLPALVFDRDGAGAPVSVGPEQVRQVLAATDGPVMLLETDAGARFMMIEIERNGPYRTFGNAARQSVTFRDGLIVQTRGLGGDLMSSDEDALLAQLRRRTTGTAPYVMRFLTPEDVTREIAFTCLVTTDGQQANVALGAYSATGQVMTADCNTDDLRVSNTFIVTPGGYVAGARQWMGETQGMLSAQTLRR